VKCIPRCPPSRFTTVVEHSSRVTEASANSARRPIAEFRAELFSPPVLIFPGMRFLNLFYSYTQFIRYFNVDFLKIFWGHSPRPPYWGGATAPLHRPHLFVAPARSSRLRASLGTFCPSPFGPPFHISKYATDDYDYIEQLARDICTLQLVKCRPVTCRPLSCCPVIFRRYLLHDDDVADE